VGQPKEALQVATRALRTAAAAGFRYNSARLKLAQAQAVAGGGRGRAFSVAQMRPLVEGARADLDACKWWLSPSKYDVYSANLGAQEQQLALTRGQDSRQLVQAALPPPGPTLKVRGRQCAKCGSSSIEMPRCSGCFAVFYCSKKCQREHWPDHKDACRARQAERASGGGGGGAGPAETPAVGSVVEVFAGGRAQRRRIARIAVASSFADGSWECTFE
jgi:hypothetical protein